MLFISGEKSKGVLVDVESKIIQRQYVVGQLHRYAAAYNPNKHLVLANEARGCSLFLTPSMQQPVMRSFTPSPLTSCAITSCGTFMIAGNELGSLFSWNLLSGQLLKNFKAHLRKVNCIAISHNNTLVVTASDDSMCKVWTLSSLLTSELRDVQPVVAFAGHSLGVNCCVFFHNCEIVVSGASDCTCRVFDAFSGEQLRLLTVGDVVTAVAVSEDDLDLAVGTSRGYLHFSSFHPAESIQILPVKPQPPQQMSQAVVCKPREDGHHSPINFLGYCSKQSSSLVLSVSENGAVLWYDSKSGCLFKELMPPQKWRIHSCCYLEAPPEITKKPSCAGLSKNPLDSIQGNYLLYKVVEKESSKLASGGDTEGARKRLRNINEAADHEPVDGSLADQKTRDEEAELADLIKKNKELNELRVKMMAKLRKVKLSQK
ncbi:unnamed protein product [Phytomonas sp. EM1]|nr:unnamed protein product [Phytomonas sp. EM1]|eukprot:CCW59777.1 unnamed protein product [Phytomonas sp. isolate EM1]